MTVSEQMATELANKKAEREALRGVIQQWNANRLDLFELSEPNEDLEFHGVMRFYFQDSGQKVATKCIRVASDATSVAVIETLIEKFRPDMRMLSVPEYALYEIHENGEERKLGCEEKPLLVQLNWHIDDREGRFLLRRIDDKTNAQGVGFTSAEGSSFRRKLSKREKKQIKKQEKLSRLKSLEQDENAVPGDQNGVAEKLYTELPETSFTRSISNPEAVMRRRRQQKLERKLQQFRSKDGGPDTGGTLKIYGEALCKDVPYKTLLLSVRDSAAQVVREMLSKYGLEKVDPQLYCLVQVNSENVSGNAHQEYILDDDECPLAILMNHPSTRGSIMFHVRRRPADYMPRKRKKKPAGKWNELDHRYEDERLPFLLELNPDGSDVPSGAGVRHRLQPNVTEVGSERPIGPQAVQAQTLTLPGPTVMPRHCVIAFTENIVTLTPCSRDAHTYVNNQRIHQTTILQNGAIIKFGRMHTFRFIDPAPEERVRQRHDSNKQMDYAYDRRSLDATSQDVNSEKFQPGSATPNGGGQTPGGGQSQEPTTTTTTTTTAAAVPSSPTKSAAVAATHCPRSPMHPPEPTHNYETTFDLDGNVETASLSSSRDGNRLSQYDRQPRGTDPILPAVLEFLEETEETFLHAVITDVEPSVPQFKLAPTYTLYLSARYRASTHYRPELQPTERAHRLTVMLANVATMIQRVIQERYMDASSLAFWLANGSELLHMLKSDRHVGAFSTRAQDILADAVHTAFGSLVRCVTLELTPAMTQFMADADEPAKEAGVLQIFSNTMALLRRCRVNAALTIQLFSHLFHAINATAFNTLVSNGNLCVRWFGRRLKARLNALETWAERQGLELASQCHLATIMQATHLLQAPKYNADELAALSSTCFKLNSLQVRALLQKYQPAADEPRLPAELIENVVRVAESVADTLARADGREIRLEEEPVLGLALLLPEDGYSCEVIRGVPPGLAEFLAPLQRDGLCRMATQPTSSGYWTIYMIDHHNNLRSPSAMSNRSGGCTSHINTNQAQPEIHVIKLHKSTNGMGLSIVAAKGAGQDRLGIYIKSVVNGGAADADGRLTAGDQLLKVDGQSLVGITQEKAAEYLVRTGPIVSLEVAKQGAIFHGLATLLSQPSPVMTRAYNTRPKSELLEPAAVRPTEMSQQPATSHSMGDLLSYPRQMAACQDTSRPGGIISSRCVPETSLYRNQIERPDDDDDDDLPRCRRRAARQQEQNPIFSVPIPRSARYPAVYVSDAHFSGNVNEGEQRRLFHLSPPFPSVSVATVSPARPPKPYMPRPLISITSDNEISSVVYRDESDESDCCNVADVEETTTTTTTTTTTDDVVVEQSVRGGATSGEDYYSADYASNPFERITTPPREYARSIFERNLFDNIPYIDQTDDTTTSADRTAESGDKCERCGNGDSNFRDPLQERVDVTTTLRIPEVMNFGSDSSRLPSYDTLRANGSTLSVEGDPTLESRYEDTFSNSKDNCSAEDESGSTINDDDRASSGDTNGGDEAAIATPKMYTVMPELHLDLSGLNSDVSSDESKIEKCWKSPEEVRLGCGRVAALTRHFARLGDAGLIKFRSAKLTDCRQFASEPNIVASSDRPRRRRRKECKSDTDLRIGTEENSPSGRTIGRRDDVILVDVETDHCARIPSANDDGERIDAEGIPVNRITDEDRDIVENGASLEKDDATTTIDNGGSKLTLEQREMIARQLERFSNLDSIDAPLFIPEERIVVVSPKNERNNGASSSVVVVSRRRSLPGTERASDPLSSSTSLPSVCPTSSPSRSSIVPSSRNSASAEDVVSHDRRYRGKRRPNSSYMFLDVSSLVKDRSDGNNTSVTVPSVNVLRVRIIGSFCSSEDNLIGVAICERGETERGTGDYHRGGIAELTTRSCENIVNGEHPSSDSADRARSSEDLRGSCDLSRECSRKVPKKCPTSSTTAATTLARTAKTRTEFTGDRSSRRRRRRYQSLEELNSTRGVYSVASQSADAQTTTTTTRRRSEGNDSRARSNVEAVVEYVSRNETGDEKLQRWTTGRKSRSELDILRRRSSDSERDDDDGWSFREIGSLRNDNRSVMRPRRMSERDLPSRLGHDTATPQQIHSSKSVPALHNMGTETKQQHEVFNPGYSRASSSNSVTPPVQPPPMTTISSTTSLRSRSSHNLHDPMRIGTLPPTGLVSRQQSSPNLNPNPTLGNAPSNAPSVEAERFYQNLSIYRNQDSTMKQQQIASPQQLMDDRNPQHNQKISLRDSQSSLNRPSAMEIGGHLRERPMSAYVAQSQQQQSYSATIGNQMQQQQQQQSSGPPPSRSQSSRDIIRQEAKIQEMQEEARRRELRSGGGAPSSLLNQHRSPAAMYNVGVRPSMPPSAQQLPNILNVRAPRPLVGSTSSLGATIATTGGYAARQNAPAYAYSDAQQYAQYGGQYGQYPNQYPSRYPLTGGGGSQYGSMIPKPKSETMVAQQRGGGHQPSMSNENQLGRESQSGGQETTTVVRSAYAEQQSRHFAQNSPHYPNGVNQYASNDGVVGVDRAPHNGESNPTTSPAETAMPTKAALSSEGAFSDSPPPPPPSTSTHPLYSKQQTDTRYTASLQDPPRGSYYPASGINAMQQLRQYQYSATNPWQREEKEKEQARRREAARQWRDQQIAELSALTHRTQQQEEQLRALQLERDFQKRAEEAAANQDDDEESNDLDNESVQRVQGLLRMAANQERGGGGGGGGGSAAQQSSILSRANAGNQSVRGGGGGGLPFQTVTTGGHSHVIPPNQTAVQSVGMSGSGQENSGGLHVQPTGQSDEQQTHLPSNYGAPLNHFGQRQQPYPVNVSHSVEDKELQRRMDELKRKQAELDESQKKQEEQLHLQQSYQHSQKGQFHPGMLRLDNLIINGPAVPMSPQNSANDAPPPPERGSSYAVMSQQSSLRSNGSTASNLPPVSQQLASKRVSFHDTNVNNEPTLRSVPSVVVSNPPSMSMDTIREDPNNFINDAETLLASPKTPEGSGTSFTGSTPGVIGAQEVYKDPRQKRLAEKQKQQQQNSQIGAVPEKLSFKEKMKMFAMETGEDGTPRDKVKISRAQREIDNIGSPLNSNSNNNNNNNTNSNRT